MHDLPSVAAPPPPGSGRSGWRAESLLVAILAGYILACLAGWPQAGRDRLVAHQHAAALHSGGRAPLDQGEPEPHQDTVAAPPPLTTLPFVLLLAAIAVFPLAPRTTHWWEHNSSKLLVAGLLAALTLSYYAFLHPDAVDLHFPAHAVVPPSAGGPSWATAGAVLANALLAEYVPFITLLFALYCVTGGVRIEGDLIASPRTNTSFLAIGALLASFIGTTGAAMLLVRPLLETNKERKHVAHTLVFFIFIVCNCGGCLLPIGDPPLFLGYLEGVDFLWTLSLWKPWLLTNGLLLAIYFLWDTCFAHPRETARDIARDERQSTPLSIRGLWPNLPLMAAVIAAVALLDPAKPFPGTAWHPWVFLREALLVGIVLVSLLRGDKRIRADNGFTYGAILEVAALFLGIFICMQPALAILHERGATLGLSSPRSFFWATGALSSVLDNAPTYLVFFKAAQALPSPGPTMAGVEVGRLAAVSLGSVFLGAMTYIGNGPNFMVKAIAEQAGVRMPSFFGYLLYSFGVLLPVFVFVSLFLL
ncbi:MAG: sodium:proton antiporter [Planctomycetota bacterium]|nr:MAG: sodium:proton antiporter [Planctomycetota bacterium]